MKLWYDAQGELFDFQCDLCYLSVRDNQLLFW
jgi:hypothetical protein